MSFRSSGIWCDLCKGPILDGPYWDISINGKKGHSCDKCKEEYAGKVEKPVGDNELF